MPRGSGRRALLVAAVSSWRVLGPKWRPSAAAGQLSAGRKVIWDEICRLLQAALRWMKLLASWKLCAMARAF